MTLHYALAGLRRRRRPPTGRCSPWCSATGAGCSPVTTSPPSPTPRRASIWDLGPVVAERGPGVLVLGRGEDRAHAPALATRGRRGRSRGSPRCGAPTGPAAGGDLVPSDQEQFATLVGPGREYSQIAAVAKAELVGPAQDRTGGRRPDPGEPAELRPAQRRSAAGWCSPTRSPTSRRAARPGRAAPTWLVEGFADYVGYLGSGISVRSAGRELAADLARGGGPAGCRSTGTSSTRTPRWPRPTRWAGWPAGSSWPSPTRTGSSRFYRAVGENPSEDSAGRRRAGVAGRVRRRLRGLRDPVAGLPRRAARVSGHRAPAVVVLVLLLGALAVLLVTTTPWRTLPGPVPGGRVAVSPATDFSPAERAREEALHSSLDPVAYTSLALSLLLTAVLGFTPLGARLLGALSLGGRLGWPLRLVLGLAVLSALGTALALPFRARAELLRREYGLSTRDWGGFALDQLRGVGVNLAVLAVVLLVVYALVRAFPQRLVGAGRPRRGGVRPRRLVPLPGAGGARVQPLHPAAGRPAADRAAELAAERDGVPVSRGAGRRRVASGPPALNAYVSGFGSEPPDRRLRHPAGPRRRRRCASSSRTSSGTPRATTCCTAPCSGRSGSPRRRSPATCCSPGRGCSRRAGVGAPATRAASALLLALVAFLAVAAGPLQNLVSRRVEARADVARPRPHRATRRCSPAPARPRHREPLRPGRRRRWPTGCSPATRPPRADRAGPGLGPPARSCPSRRPDGRPGTPTR